MWYTAADVMTILGVKQTKAYQVIKSLADEISKTKMPDGIGCYARPAGGKIQKSFFCKKFMLSQKECDKIIAQSKSSSVSA